MGLGSFYNHFTGKPDLFDAAVADALEEYAQAVDERLHGVDDPAERLAGGVRLSARMAESYPEIMQILFHSELGRICAGDGLAPRAKRDVEQGMDPVAHRPTGADCAPAPATCVMDRGGWYLSPAVAPQPQSWMGRWRGPRSMAFWR
ncbi:TetR/AcrR family transcriptional regulator [Streptomyces sp. NPDC048275]|uniref:TetR/AcrR family transcriptional regulator n=1 Tax=Streptomyces sp. NPDC048275 TaxID=3155629 RepID=UPI0033F5AE58